ncbi:hypothetical protein [Hyalangium rubrum]|uniref:Uncharacterized protein n=1 Tax=Hyalangium rubrum TaxID=3103134 RepID=A0ABU5H4E3_9BACT|nr:hypothetical protein [Hyalangium sp. s54d21]MDY7226960.1 hypothetical protein [Hyalangium sp. s54d21]
MSRANRVVAPRPPRPSSPTSPHPVGTRPPVFSPTHPEHNLSELIQDAREAALDGDMGPPEPSDYHALRGRLEAARASLPPVYREAFYQPFLSALDGLGPMGFSQVLQSDPRREGTAALLLDVAHAILQNAEGYERVATDAFQEVVSDLYDGFLSAGDRRGVKPPDRGVIPPLVKWGNPSFGPYTWPVDATSEVLGLEAGVVSLPPANARQGLLAWAALPHEAAGHDVLHADSGLAAELAWAVYARLKAEDLEMLGEYWAERIDETASDVLGILNMGPTAGLGLVGYFRGLNAAWGGEPRLRSEGPAGDSHPADLLRGYLAAATVSKLQFTGRQGWTRLIEQQVEEDRADVVLAGEPVSLEKARLSAGFVAEVIVTHRAAALEGHALGQIQNWRDADQTRVARLSQRLLSGPPELPGALVEGTYAAHLVAAAIEAALVKGAAVRPIHARMVRLLKQMHDANPSWGPLFIRHRGNAIPHRAYMPRKG